MCTFHPLEQVFFFAVAKPLRLAETLHNELNNQLDVIVFIQHKAVQLAAPCSQTISVRVFILFI